MPDIRIRQPPENRLVDALSQEKIKPMKGNTRNDVTKSLSNPVKVNLFVLLACAMIFLMEVFARWFARYKRFTLRVSIFNRVLIGNSLIIIFGAIAGTIFTRQLTLLGDARLILLFSFFGILITLVVNYWIIRSALHPLNELGVALEKMDEEQINIPDSLKHYEDPTIHHLITALNSTLLRLANRTSQLRAISERAINAQEEERVRIARGLHDETAQSISMLIIRLERLQSLIPANVPDLTRQVAEAHKLATRLFEDLRHIIWNLRPSILDDLGLVPAIRWFARANLEEAGVRVDFGKDNEMVRLPSHLETLLFRVAQEAVNNILHHADAKNVTIRLWTEQGQVCLEVQDDGRGFDVERTSGEAVSKKRLGLLGIKERVSLVGGSVTVESAPGSGACVHVRVPLPGEELHGTDKTEKMELQEGGMLK
jgi:two-component system sensor histidine kinase UhpB